MSVSEKVCTHISMYTCIEAERHLIDADEAIIDYSFSRGS